MSFTYEKGGVRTATTYNFVSTFDAIEPERDDKLTRRFGRQRLTGIMDMFNLKKPSQSLKYEHWEEDRLYPKIKATNGGAGAAGAAVTFDLASTAVLDYPLNVSPYQGSGSSTKASVPVRVNDVILIKPASGVVAYGSYIQCLVTAVAPTAGANGQFTAQPTDATDAIPSIASADEIIIIGNAHGEGSTQPKALSTTATKFENQIQTFKEKRKVTGVEACMKHWFQGRDGSHYFMMEGETETYDRFLNSRELNMLFSRGLTSSSLADVYDALETPIVMNNGLASEILDRGNEYNYTGLTGLSIADLEAIVLIIDKQKGAKENLMCNGIEINGQIDRELGDRFVNGGISYGMFKMDQEKHVSLNFKTIDINGYKFHKKTLDAMNDLQSLGADGYGFPKESMILPAEDATDPNEGIKVPSMRLRYLQKKGSVSQEIVTVYVDNLRTSDDGEDTEEVRYKSYCGIESFAMNRAVYVKQA
jgi:hypothetical protein